MWLTQIFVVAVTNNSGSIAHDKHADLKCSQPKDGNGSGSVRVEYLGTQNRNPNLKPEPDPNSNSGTNSNPKPKPADTRNRTGNPKPEFFSNQQCKPATPFHHSKVIHYIVCSNTGRHNACVIYINMSPAIMYWNISTDAHWNIGIADEKQKISSTDLRDELLRPPGTNTESQKQRQPFFTSHSLQTSILCHNIMEDHKGHFHFAYKRKQHATPNENRC